MIPNTELFKTRVFQEVQGLEKTLQMMLKSQELVPCKLKLSYIKFLEREIAQKKTLLSQPVVPNSIVC